MADRQQLELAIAAQESLRGVVSDDVVDAAIAALRDQLGRLEPEVERRRQVTVLFADVSGFTAMSSELDPEVVAARMNELWSELDRVVVSHGGRVDKHIGDALMAVWGAATTGEDDPERAVRAGLALQDAIRAGGHHGLAMRVGVNTGPAHVGAIAATGELTTMGDTVNVASRAQGVAPLGGVLVTHDTYRHIRGVFDVEAIEPVLVKGKPDPIAVYVVHRAKDRVFRVPARGVEGIETLTIGRAGELAALGGQFDRAIEDASARLVTILGEAGIGKSRLLYEFENWLELHPTPVFFFKGRALPVRQSVTFGLLRDVVADRFGVLDSDVPEDVVVKLRRGFGGALTHDQADLVGQWLGFDLQASDAVRRLLGSATFAVSATAHFLDYLAALAAENPVVIFLEDLHWADDDSLDLVAELAARVSSSRLVIIGVARPTLVERASGQGVVEASHVTLALAPLGTDAVRTLVEEILQRADHVPAGLLDLITERADGNAFYVEELVKMLIEEGVIETGGPWDAWTIHEERLDPAQVPSTLTGVLQSRLDSLAVAEREVLQRSSVVGRTFWDDTVASLAGASLDATSRSLAVARGRELVFAVEPSSFDGTSEYSFKHALLRDVVYDTVLLRDRQRLHAAVAAWIADRAGDRSTEFAGLLATHLRLAGDAAGAAEQLHRSAAAALAAGTATAAQRALDEAFELWRSAGQEPPVAALIEMADACLRSGDLDVADRVSRAAVERATVPADRARALYLASWVASERGELERELVLLDEALPVAEDVGGVVLAQVLGGLCWATIARGDLDQAEALAARADGLVETLDDRDVRRQVTGLLGAVASQRGDYAAAMGHSIDALAIAVESGDLEGQALAESNLGVVHHLLGDAGSAADHVAALDRYRRALVLSRRLGRKVGEANGMANMAQVELRLGHEEAAGQLLRGAFSILSNIGAVPTLLFCVLVEADRRLVAGDVMGGLELIGLVQSHPAQSIDHISEIGRMLARLDVPDAVVAVGTSRGAALDFDATVERLMAELEAVVPATGDTVELR